MSVDRFLVWAIGSFLIGLSLGGQDPQGDYATLQAIESALGEGQYDRAATLAAKLAEDPPSERARLFAADALLRSGKPRAAVPLFDRYAAQRPAAKPYLWQRGIALFFAGRYEDGAKQFEIHREVNPNDVENAAWHFLCVAKGQSPERAKALLLPAPGDSRAPMEEVLQLLRSGESSAVEERLAELGKQTAAGQSAHFYGQLYLGLYDDALGKADEAQRHLDDAVTLAPRNYMGDVARVYAAELKRRQSATPQREDAQH